MSNGIFGKTISSRGPYQGLGVTRDQSGKVVEGPQSAAYDPLPVISDPNAPAPGAGAVMSALAIGQQCANVPAGWSQDEWNAVCTTSSAANCYSPRGGVSPDVWRQVCGDPAAEAGAMLDVIKANQAASSASMKSAAAQLLAEQSAALKSAGKAGTVAAAQYATNAAAQAQALAKAATKSYTLPILAGVGVLAIIGLVVVKKIL